VIVPPPLRAVLGWLFQRTDLARRVATDHATDGIPVRILAPAVWRYRDGLSYEEIAALLDITEGEARRRVLLAWEAYGQRVGGIARRQSKAGPVK
jgi:DNA-directed RNA polymerase specialized sigma24 family protein